MKKTTSIIALILLGTLLYSQDKIPTKKELKKSKIDSSLNVSTLFNSNKKWEEVAKFDCYKNQYILIKKPAQISILNENTVNYITPADQLNVIDKNNFEIVYGGSGPERQTFTLITFVSKYLILESQFTSEGYVNGKLAWERKSKFRYVWKLKD